MRYSLVYLLDCMWCLSVSGTTRGRSFCCIFDLSSSKWLCNLLSFFLALNFNISCRKSLVTSIVVSFANLLHPIVVGHVEGLMWVDSSLRITLFPYWMLIIEQSWAVRIVRLRVETALPWVVLTRMFKIDFRKFCRSVVCWTVPRALRGVCRYCWHISWTNIINRVEGICTFTCIKWCVHPLFRCLWRDSCRILKWVCVGTCLWDSRVIQIELSSWLLLHVNH